MARVKPCRLMPAILGVCMPTRSVLTRSGVLAGIVIGLFVLYLTLVQWPHPLGLHAAIWSVSVNGLVAVIVSRFTAPPSEDTVRRIHGEVERFVYGS